jgi:hypothetical protein
MESHCICLHHFVNPIQQYPLSIDFFLHDYFLENDDILEANSSLIS